MVLGEENTTKHWLFLGATFSNLIECSKRTKDFLFIWFPISFGILFASPLWENLCDSKQSE